MFLSTVYWKDENRENEAVDEPFLKNWYDVHSIVLWLHCFPMFKQKYKDDEKEAVNVNVALK